MVNPLEHIRKHLKLAKQIIGLTSVGGLSFLAEITLLLGAGKVKLA